MISRLKDTLLIVSDRAESRQELRQIFESSFNLLEAESLTQARLFLEQNLACIAAVLVDMEEKDDDSVTEVNRAARRGSDIEIPIISIITPTGTGSREEKDFLRGASDVILKPYTTVSIRRRVQQLVDLHLHKWHLQNLVKEQSETIRNTNQVMLDALSAIIEHRSTESGNHVLRIRRFTKLLLENVALCCPEYGLTESSIDIISGASALHDIGKITIPDAILNKPGRLSEEEYETIKTHSTVGSQLILTLSGMGDTEYLRYAYNIALYHHERWDGSGYPKGLAGDDIPICAQVVGLADAFDALTTDRSYKSAYSCEQAVNMILNGECGAFSPKLLECFKNVRSRFAELAHRYADGWSPKDDAITLPLPGPDWSASPLAGSQLALVKYHTMLHYTGSTVLELDLNTGLFHMVYNPDPELESIIPDASAFTPGDLLNNLRLHPDDLSVGEEVRHFLKEGIFGEDIHRRAFFFRIFSHGCEDWRRYELVFLRINTGNKTQRIVLCALRRTGEGIAEKRTLSDASVYSSPALQGLVSTAIRCRVGTGLTIDGGAEELFPLIGYTKEEIFELFGGKFMNLIAEVDRETVVKQLHEGLYRGGHAETEFRIIRKNGPPLWVLAKSRAFVERDGQEYIYLAIRDISRAKEAERELDESVQRNQAVVDMIGGIVFQWDMDSDTMYCSPGWERRFGYVPVSKNYGKQMGIGTHFHPDDLPIVQSAIARIKERHKTVSVDVRIADSNARYLWSRIIAAAHPDADGNLKWIVGVIQDVDSEKRAELALQEQAERDSLTELYNKASVQKIINSRLASRDGDSLCALMMIDLDNFKSVNDTYGHLYGDSLLAQVGKYLRQLFRSNDVLGRVGGDEFVVFMDNKPNTRLVHDRCELLRESLGGLFEAHCAGLEVSCSIGVALVPDHAEDYAGLFRRADEALYRTKRMGKNNYSIYSPSSTGDGLELGAAAVHTLTRIDSDVQPGLADASFVRYVFRRLYESRDVEESLNGLLANIGEQLNVSRVYIFENNDDNTCCSNTFEWCAEGITPEKENLQNVSYIDDIAGWDKIYDEKGLFYCTDISSLQPHFRAILEPQGIKSMLQCSIVDKGVFRGYVGFDECSINRLWTQSQIDLLQFLAEVIGIFLLKRRAQDALAAMESAVGEAK